jgi:hypothetical protein
MLGIVGLQAGASAAGLLREAEDYQLSSVAYKMTAGDFNRDGISDLAVSVYGMNTIQIWLGNGDGTFRVGESYVATFPSNLATDDFNGDGNLDLVTFDMESSIPVQFSWFLSGNGDGTFAHPSMLLNVSTFGPYSNPGFIVGDFNGDGKPDLSVTLGYAAAVALGDGTGSFLPYVETPVGSPIKKCQPADLDGDGKTDLGCLNGNGMLTALFSEGDGTFSVASDIWVGGSPVSLDSHDVNGDGLSDIVVSGSAAPGIYIVFGSRDRHLNHSDSFLTSRDASGLNHGDYDGDGRTDIALIRADRISILLKNEDGTYSPEGEYEAEPGHYIWSGSSVGGKFNGDNRTDIAVLTVLNNSTAHLLVFNSGNPGTFRLASSAYSASEGVGSVTVAVYRDGGSYDQETVDYATSDGTARAGSDYAATSGTLVFGPGETYRTISIPILDDSEDEEDETFTFALSNPSGGASIASPAAAVVTIVDDDPPGPIPDTDAPTWPADALLGATAITQTSLVLDWPAASDNVGVDAYEIYEASAPAPIATVSESVYSYSVKGLTAGTGYAFTVVAKDAANNESAGLSRALSTAAIPPSVPKTSSGPASPLSGNANVKELVLLANGLKLQLTPRFANGITEYTATTEADEIEIRITPEDALAVVTQGEETLKGSKKFPLRIGKNTMVFALKAQDGTVNKITIAIERIPHRTEEMACSFADLDGHWARAQLCEALQNGIVQGASAASFEPDRSVTRAEFAVMLLRALGASSDDEPSGYVPFGDAGDIPAWAVPAIRYATANGILTGYPGGDLRPGAPISRAEMAVMLGRAMKWPSASTPAQTSFSDDSLIPSWAQPYAREALNRGLMQGKGSSRFAPEAAASRAESAVVVLRMLQNSNE